LYFIQKKKLESKEETKNAVITDKEKNVSIVFSFQFIASPNFNFCIINATLHKLPKRLLLANNHEG